MTTDSSNPSGDAGITDQDGNTYQDYANDGRLPEHTLSEAEWNAWVTGQAQAPASGIPSGTDKLGKTIAQLGIQEVPSFVVNDNPVWDKVKIWRNFEPVTDSRSGSKWMGSDLSNAVFCCIMLHMTNDSTSDESGQASPFLRLNEFSRKVEYRGETIRDTDYTRMKLKAMEVALVKSAGSYSPTSAIFREAAQYVAYHQRYNPAINRLDSLKWDGIPRLDNLRVYFEDKKKPNQPQLDEMDEIVLKLIIMGMVARTYKPGYKFDYMPIIVGKQGAAKGLWLKSLCLVEDSYTASFNIHARDLMKHEVEVCAGKSIVEIGEQAGWDKQGIEDIKRFITMDEAEARKAYAYEAIAAKRTFVLVATVNTARLDDRTGNRRFPICDWKQASLKEDEWYEDVEQVIAEAVALWKSGEGIPIIPREFWERFEERAETHIQPTTFESWIQENFEHSWFTQGHTMNEFEQRFFSSRQSPGDNSQVSADEPPLIGLGSELARGKFPSGRTFKPMMEQLGFKQKKSGSRREYMKR